MTEHELQAVEDAIRELLTNSPLQWLLDEVDEAISAGVPEERLLRRRTRGATGSHGLDRGADTVREAEVPYETVSLNSLATGQRESWRKTGSLVITTRPMTTKERVQLFYSALRRALLEVPEIEQAALKALLTPPESGDEGRRRPVTTVRFVPDEETRRRGERAKEMTGHRLETAERERLAFLFDRATEETRS